MKLIEANIKNFGKLQNEKIKFNENLHIFLQENGWGKTTLSAFIKAMFYGMEHTTKKSLAENEKKKYKPWQGGIYGGSLTFSYEGKEYRVNRTFGEKKNEDTFELIDLKTNKISNDFSSDLGMEIFGIGRETYARSVFINLSESPVGSNDISAKLNNLVEDNDVSNFDEACAVLEKKATSIKAKRGNSGEIYVIQGKIDENRQKLEDVESKLKQNAELEKLILLQDEKISNLEKMRKDIAEEISNNAKYESKIRYDQLKSDLENLENEKDDIIDFFKGKVPSAEILKKINLLCSDFVTTESNIKNQGATQSEKNDYEQLKSYFAGDIPTKEQIEECIKNDENYKNFLKEDFALKLSEKEEIEFNLLKEKYENQNVSSEIIANHIENVEKVQKKKNELAEEKVSLSNEEILLQSLKQTKPKNVKRISFIIAGIIVALSSVLGIILNILPLGIVLASLGVILIGISFAFKNKKQDFSEKEDSIKSKKEKIDELSKEIFDLENQYKKFIAQFYPNATSELVALSSINNEFESFKRLFEKNRIYSSWLKNQKSPEENKNLIKTFVNRYCKTNDISSVQMQINILNEKLKKLEFLENRINEDFENEKKFNEQKQKLDLILKEFQTDKTSSYSEQVKQINENNITLKNFENQIEDARKKILDFENENKNQIEEFKNLVKSNKTVEELKSKMNEISSKYDNEIKFKTDYVNRIESNITFTDKKEDIETEIENLSIKKREKDVEHKILSKTKELLSVAKEKIDANYSDPMKEGFEKYVKMLGSDLNLVINTNLEVSVDNDGKLYESESLSDGYKDLVNFCSRMALIDALFKDVKAPVILDDPFVNLDDEKIPNALKLIKDISKDRQIIYFSCHKSREIKD